MHNKKLRFQCLNNGNLYRGICFGSIDIQLKVSILKEKSLTINTFGSPKYLHEGCLIYCEYSLNIFSLGS